MKKRLLTAKELAELLNISEKSVYAMAQRQELPCVKVGSRSVRFDPDDIREWLVSKKSNCGY